MPPPPSDAPKSLRDARYAIIRALGEGGQGATFEAVDKLRGKPVAIKRFRVRGAKSWKEVELAEREAKVLSSLSHPNLPRYIEHFEERGELFLVTDMIEGQSLAEVRQAGRTLDEAEVIRFLKDASKALDYLHGRAPQVIHRDIKPSNVLRRPDGSFVLIDFGSVRDRMKPAGGSTVVGTFGYMAPEQFQGRAMPASDVYAVATTALTLLTGVEPEDLPHRGLAIDVGAALAGRRVSPDLAAALTAMLDPDPDKRASRIAPHLDAILRHAPRPSPPPADPRPERAGSRPGESFGEQLVHVLGQEIKREILEHVEAAADRAREHREKQERRRQRIEHKREEREHKREAKEHARDAREIRRERKAEIKAIRREGRRIEQGGDRPIPGIVLGFMILGLVIAQLAVTVALQLVVPAFLWTLSLVFGKGMRPSARAVHDAGKRAAAAISGARENLRGRQTTDYPAEIRVKLKDEPPARQRVEVPIDPVEEAEREANAELAAEEEALRAERQGRGSSRR